MSNIISIIVPIYNVEEYLERCIDSILSQSYNNIEVILVDDGSVDNSKVICCSYAERDERIKVIAKKNEGPAEARNVALRYAKGDYITFIDADDFVSNDYISYLYKLIKKHDADIACCNTSIFKKGNTVKVKKHIKYEKIMCVDDALCQMLYEKNFSNSVWGKMYKKELFKDISFPKGKIFEDMFTTYKVFMVSNKIVYGNQEKYFYMKHDKSIMNTTKSHARMQVIEAENELIKDLGSEKIKVLKAAYSKLFASSVVGISSFEIPTTKILLKNDVDMLWGIIVKFRLMVLFNSKVQFKYKLLAAISFFGKRFLTFFYVKFIK